MDTINTKQKNSLIIFVVLALIILGVFYFKSRKVAESPVVDTETGDQTNSNTTTNPEGEVKDTATPDSVETSLAEKAEQAKFNLALSNGSNALNQKDYAQALIYLKEALNYKDSDLVYIRLFSVYSLQNNIDQARLALEKAIALNPSFTDYWVTKLTFLDEKTNVSFADLKVVYQNGLKKVDPKYKINLVTSFARIAENNKEYTEAIALWEYAKTVYPQNASIYQIEIDRLNAMK